MATFANAFWGGGDYAAGFNVLFGKLQQGVAENTQIHTLAKLRAEAEELYGQKLSEIDTATERIRDGFQRDDGASVKKAYEGVRTEMAEAAKNHKKIASNIRELVVLPFGRWCEQHALRVQNSQDELTTRLKAHDKQTELVRQSRSQYYNKCRKVEDLDEEEKLAFQDPQKPLSPKLPVPKVMVSPDTEPDNEEDEPVVLGDITYAPERLKQVLTHILENIRLGETKVPILGTYHNVTTGAEIVDYIRKHMDGTSVAYAERIGQDLVDEGLLRLIGNMGNAFANSSRMYYQWRTKAFKITGLPEKRSPAKHATSDSLGGHSALENPNVAAVTEYLSGWNPLNKPHGDETPADKLRREAHESDEKYKAAVKRLDTLRCTLEELMVDHMRFMERCELDRLKAVKSVILDFSGAIGNVIPSLQSTVDNMMLFQETVQPAADLRYLLENYRNGSFTPRVQIYENYYNRVDDQMFGVDVEARARADRKRVPLLVTTLLMYLDRKYPELDGDAARRGIWLVDVPLGATHHLRNNIIATKGAPIELLEKYDVPIVASLVKLYLLELPDSLVSSNIYEIIKTIYTTTAQSTDELTRVSVIQSTLGQLRLANIATLDAITSHFSRLIELTSADEQYVAALASSLAPCFLRPKQENALTVTEKYNVRLVRDLFAHKDAIFGELKRSSSLNSAQERAVKQRERHVSRDESHRREAMEERQRAIQAANADRMRAPSPNRRSISHRRDRSTSAETRFPIATAPATNSPVSTRIRNGSLDVPFSPTTSPGRNEQQPQQQQQQQQTNGSSDPDAPNPPIKPRSEQPRPQIETRGRSGTRTSNRSSSPVLLTSSLNGPTDFVSSPDYYSYAQDDSISTGFSNRDSATLPNYVVGGGQDVHKPPPHRGSASTIDSVGAVIAELTQANAAAANGGNAIAVPQQPTLPGRQGSTASVKSINANGIKRSSGSSGGGRSASKGPAFPRRTTNAGGSGLQRQSLVMSKRDSVDSFKSASGGEVLNNGVGVASGGGPDEERRGVELVDRPMDDDD